MDGDTDMPDENYVLNEVEKWLSNHKVNRFEVLTGVRPIQSNGQDIMTYTLNEVTYAL